MSNEEQVSLVKAVDDIVVETPHHTKRPNTTPILILICSIIFLLFTALFHFINLLFSIVYLSYRTPTATAILFLILPIAQTVTTCFFGFNGIELFVLDQWYKQFVKLSKISTLIYIFGFCFMGAFDVVCWIGYSITQPYLIRDIPEVYYILFVSFSIIMTLVCAIPCTCLGCVHYFNHDEQK